LTLLTAFAANYSLIKSAAKILIKIETTLFSFKKKKKHNGCPSIARSCECNRYSLTKRTERPVLRLKLRETSPPELNKKFEKPDTAKLVREVAVALMGGRYVNIPCAGGGSVSSETGWDGRKKDEENEDFRLR